MVEREDLDPEDMVVAEMEDEDDHGLADVIRATPHTTEEWQMKALVLGIRVRTVTGSARWGPTVPGIRKDRRIGQYRGGMSSKFNRVTHFGE